MATLAQAALLGAQKGPKYWFDNKVQLREFAPVNRSLLLLSPEHKLQVKWQALHVVQREVSTMDYEVEIHQKWLEMFHVNLLMA